MRARASTEEALSAGDALARSQVDAAVAAVAAAPVGDERAEADSAGPVLSSSPSRTGLTFLDALRVGRPMRRPSAIVQTPWLHLGVRPSAASGASRPQWRRIDTGEEWSLALYEYLANDWEVMP